MQGKYLADLISDYDKYTANLTQLNVKEQELVIKADAFASALIRPRSLGFMGQVPMTIPGVISPQ